MAEETYAEIWSRLFVSDLLVVTDLDVLVVPSCEFVGLPLGEPPGTGRVKEDSSKETAADEVDSIVMAKVHGRPPDPDSVGDEEPAKLGKAVAHE